ncbi:MAG: hypothetical protein HY534_04510 [Chloroflexi bacterium]|nr:hypothetical protein [Chloroflexota bacterium]
MLAVRRLYFFIVSAVSLGMLTGGAAWLGSSVIELALGVSPFGPDFRESLATSFAVLLVGLPIWAFHWSASQRLAARNSAERASTLRRLYLYAVVAAFTIASAIFASQLLQELLEPAAAGTRLDGPGALTSAWRLALMLILWSYHSTVVAGDRQDVGETAGSATLRRWYVYGVQFVAVVMSLFGARDVLHGALTSAGTLGTSVALAKTLGATLSWLAVWVGLARGTAVGRVLAEDRASTLHTVQGFLIVALSVAIVLGDASRLLYYLLARALGVESPGGITALNLDVLARPLSTVLVFGSVWVATRHRLRRDTAEAESPRQAGVRRLYQHLVALLSLAAVAMGLGNLLYALLEVVIPPSLPTWRDPLSFSLTLIAVGLPMWLLHWKPSPAPDERLAFSRRLYLFATLAACVLALLIGGAALIKTVVDSVLAASFGQTAKSIAPAASAIVVASGLGAYHWRVLQLDVAEGASGEAELPASEAPEPLRVEVTGASEGELRQALAHLPPGTSYSILPAAMPDASATRL